MDMKTNIFLPLLLLVATSSSALAATAFEYGGYKYEVLSEEASTVTLATGQPKYAGHNTIPEKVMYEGKEYTVTEVAIRAFNTNFYMTGISLPATVTKIGDYAFANSSKIETIEAPGVEVIGNNAFQYAGVTSVSFPNAKSIGANAFNNASSLVSADLPNVETMGYMAFYNSRKLTSVNIGNKITSLPDNAFGNSAITSFTIPASVETIGRAPFGGCASLKEVTIENGVVTLGDRVFAGTAIEDIILPNSITSMGSETFDGCKSLVSASLPDNFTTLPNGTFKNCTSLTSMDNLPAKLQSIGASAFENCSALTSVTIPETVESVGASAFAGCNSLISFYIGSALNTFDITALKGLTALKEINVSPDNTNYSSESSVLFNKDKSILYIFPCANKGDNGSYTVPESVKSVAQEAFCHSNSIKSVKFTGKLETLGFKAFNESTVESVVMPEEIKEWATNVFDNAAQLSDITLPGSNTVIPQMSFYKCVSLPTVTVPEGYVTIGEDAFSGCGGLESIYLPSTLENIEKGGFDKCTGVKEIHLASTMDPICAPYSLDGISRTGCTLYVPTGCKKVYQQADTWGEFTNIVEDTQSGIDGIIAGDNDDITVTATAGSISITSPVQQTICVYNISGTCMHKVIASDVKLDVVPGIYIVTIGQKTLKISVN